MHMKPKKNNTNFGLVEFVKTLDRESVLDFLTESEELKENLKYSYDFNDFCVVYEMFEKKTIRKENVVYYLVIVANHIYNKNKLFDYSYESCLFYHYFNLFDVSRYLHNGLNVMKTEDFNERYTELYETAKRLHNINFDIPVSRWDINSDEALIIAKDILEKKKHSKLDEKDIKCFYSILLKSCEGIDPEAHFLLANELYGEGVDPVFKFQRSYKKALTEYIKAGDFGNYKGYMNAGYIYYYNRLNDPSGENYEEAFKLFAIGRNHNDLEANYKISDFYFNGYFVSKNVNEAYYIVESSVEEALAHAVKGDLFYLGPYSLREARILELRNNPLNDGIILADFLVCDYCYKDRIKKRDFFGDLMVLNNNKGFIKNTIERTKMETKEMKFPYTFDEGEFEQFLYKAPYYINHTLNRIGMVYQFKDNKIYLNLDFNRPPFFVLLKGLTAYQAYKVNLVIEVEEQLPEMEGPILLESKSLITINLFGSNGKLIELDNKTYHIKKITVTNIKE